jgi:uncharacterized membrane protein
MRDDTCAKGVFCARSTKGKLAMLEDKMRSGERQRKFGLLAPIVGLLVGIPGFAKADVNFTFNTIDVPLCGPSKNATCPRTAVNGNSTNAIVGEFDDDMNPPNTHGFILSGGVYTQINAANCPRGPVSGTMLNGINASGQLVGTYADTSCTTGHAFFFSGNSFNNRNNYTTVDPKPNVRSQGGFINTQGQVVGTYRTSASATAPARSGFLWQSGSFISPPTPINDPNNDPASGTTVFGINDSGQIVGTYLDKVSHRHGFFRDSQGIYTTLDAPTSPTFTVAEGINNSGAIVGWYVKGNSVSHGFLLTGGVWTTIDVPGAMDTQINSINASGQIAGFYVVENTDGTTTTHGFVGTPK